MARSIIVMAFFLQFIFVEGYEAEASTFDQIRHGIGFFVFIIPAMLLDALEIVKAQTWYESQRDLEAEKNK